MSLIRRLFGRPGGDSYAEGIALYETGRFAEAIALLRRAQQGGREGPRSSLVAFHLRQALTAEGRRLLRVGQPAAAGPLLAEAIAGGDDYPDVKFLLGAAHGLTGDWDEALRCARDALRRNADYAEARLLEAGALLGLERRREASESLNKLLETGRRQASPLIQALERPDGFDPQDLPADLEERLREAVTGRDEEEEVGTAVALCRAGHWDEGIAQLRRLVELHPGYADYRLKLAAALFQTGQGDAAGEEVASALHLNPRYRTAALLKALILADERRLEAARAILAGPPVAGGTGRRGHEDLFAAYLRAALGLLTGRLAEVDEELAAWGDLTRTFPKAALLRAAAADLGGRPAEVGPVLQALAEAWPAEADFRAYQANLHLRRGEPAAAERLLNDWPAARDGEADDRPLLLGAAVALARGRLPADARPREEARRDAWAFLDARGRALTGDWAGCWTAACTLTGAGYATEALGRLMTEAAAHLTGSDLVPGDWLPPTALPDGTVPHLVFLLHRQNRAEAARPLLARLGSLHPEELRWIWLAPAFWLDPIRRWIS